MTDSKSAITKDLEIRIERTMCPARTSTTRLLTMVSRIVYEGRQYVAEKGKGQGNISASQGSSVKNFTELAICRVKTGTMQ